MSLILFRQQNGNLPRHQYLHPDNSMLPTADRSRRRDQPVRRVPEFSGGHLWSNRQRLDLVCPMYLGSPAHMLTTTL